MLKTERTATLFAEAHILYDEGLKCLEEACDLWDRWLLRKSAEQTWEAALLATNALILARTGTEPEPDNDHNTLNCLTGLFEELQDWEIFTGRYAGISHDIYQQAVVEGILDPVGLLIHDIRETADYIRECERLAGVGDGDG